MIENQPGISGQLHVTNHLTSLLSNDDVKTKKVVERILNIQAGS